MIKFKYIFYRAAIFIKLLFIGLNISLLFVRLRLFTNKNKQINRVAIILPRPLGLGDLSMISPVFKILDKYESVIVLSSHENIFEDAPEWRKYDDLKSIFDNAKRLGDEGYLIYIPKSSLKAISFVRKNMNLAIIVAVSENIVIDTVNQKMFKLSRGISYSQRVINSLRFLIDDPIDEIPQRYKLAKSDLPENVKKFVQENQACNLVVLAPYVKWHTRRWPIPKWSRLIEKLSRYGNFAFIIIGTRSEHCYGDEIVSVLQQKDNIFNAMGEISIPQLGSLFESAQVMVCCDNGPMHFAISSDLKVIAIFGCTPYYHRIGENDNAVALHSYSSCYLAPCYSNYVQVFCPFKLQCIEDVRVEDVFKHIVENTHIYSRQRCFCSTSSCV